MGVPAFYRWLTQKYPKIVLYNIEKIRSEEPDLVYDNLYIDMNGLIHPCSHPEDHEPPSSEQEMYQNVCKYVDRLVAAIRPRRLLFLSVDGVAPRAKMNQQRERRYRSALEKQERKDIADDIISQKYPDYDTEQTLAWDSNVITPGTEFMQNLMTHIREYITKNMRENQLWRDIKVIFSDSSVPGEGEHKIMNYIRVQRCMPGYDPNQCHVIHGLDADLIMLALATHEPNFSILREEFVYDDPRKRHKGGSDISTGKHTSGDAWLYSKKLECVQIGALREMLANDFYFLEELLEDYDLERIIDDFVFLCFFVGNDFLPHLPTVNIRTGGIDMLLDIYKELRVIMDDYLTGPGGAIYMKQLRMILERLGEYEEHQLQLEEMDVQQQIHNAKKQASIRVQELGHNHGRKNRHRSILKGTAHRLRTRSRSGDLSSSDNDENGNADADSSGGYVKHNRTVGILHHSQLRVAAADADDGGVMTDEGGQGVPRDTSTGAANVTTIGGYDAMSSGAEGGDEGEHTHGRKEHSHRIILSTKHNGLYADGQEEQLQRLIGEEVKAREKKMNELLVEEQLINMHQTVPGDTAKDRYYNDAFRHLDSGARGGRAAMCRAYLEGLTWVLQYYYQRVPSWGWYYPFHYAPCASDLICENEIIPTYELGAPLRPVEQLLCVLPVQSVDALPIAARPLMTSPLSTIYDMFNGPIETDRRSERAWLWIQLLPFVDVNRIVDAVKKCEDSFSDNERARNCEGSAYLYIHDRQLSICSDTPSCITLTVAGDDGSTDEGGMSFCVAGSTERNDLLFGTITSPIRMDGQTVDYESDTICSTNGIAMGTTDGVICAKYNLPPHGEHKSTLLEGLTAVKFIRRRGGSGGARRAKRKDRSSRKSKKGDRKALPIPTAEIVVDVVDGVDSTEDGDIDEFHENASDVKLATSGDDNES